MCECCGGDCKLTTGEYQDIRCKCGTILLLCPGNYHGDKEYWICPDCESTYVVK